MNNDKNKQTNKNRQKINTLFFQKIRKKNFPIVKNIKQSSNVFHSITKKKKEKYSID
jgi:hypothetical protein